MSAIGPGSLGAMSFAGTQAAAKNSQKEGADAKKSASATKFQLDQRDQVEKSNGVADTDLSGERDADGRLNYHVNQQSQDDDSTETKPAQKPIPQPDAFGETGTMLNLDV